MQIHVHAVDRAGIYREQWGKPFLFAPIGTGFMVNAMGIVVTAHQVIAAGREATEKLPTPSLGIGFAQTNTEDMRANFTVSPFEILYEDSDRDIAILRPRQNPFAGQVRSGIVINDTELPMSFAWLRLATSRPRDGTPIAVSGYPLSSTVLVTTAGHVASSWDYDVQRSTIPESNLSIPSVRDAYIGDLEVNPGNSGGPVCRIADGVAIGIAVAVKKAAAVDQSGQQLEDIFFTVGLSIIVPARYVAEALERLDIPWTEAVAEA